MKYKRKKDKDFWQMARAYLHDFMPAVRNQSDKSVAAYKQSLNSYLIIPRLRPTPAAVQRSLTALQPI